MRKLKRMWYRGAPWLAVLVVGVLTFGFQSLGGFPEQGQASPTLETAGGTTAFAPTPESDGLTPPNTAPLLDEWASLPTRGGGGVKLTCSLDETVDAGNMVACQPQADNSLARCFPAMDAMDAVGVRFGVESVSENLTVTVSLYHDTNGCPPTMADLVLLGQTSVVITSADDLTVVDVPLAVSVPAGTDLVVDLSYTTVVAGAWLGGNDMGQTCPTYIASVACGLPEYTDLADIGFPNAALIVSIDGVSGEPCDEKTVRVEIFSDSRPGETSWELVDKLTGMVVGSGAPANPNMLHTWDVCVDDDDNACYNFTIFDSEGDGICCAFGNGFYNVYQNGELQCSGGEFGSSETCSDIGPCVPGELHRFEFPLEGGQAVPPVDTDGTGCCTVTLDDGTNVVDVECTYDDLSGDAIAAHIHGLAAPGDAAGVILTLTASGGTSGTITGGGTLSEADAQGLLDGLTYVNLHTAPFPAGEIRGQIVDDPCDGEPLAIVDSDPPDGAIDAGMPSDLNDCGMLFGWDEITIEFDNDADDLEAADFTVTVDPADEAPPAIVDVQHPDDDTVTLVLDGRISPEHWTRFTHNASGTWTQIGSLPADVNGDGTSGPVDILDLIDHLNGVIVLPDWGTDVDRSGVTNPADILTVIDLLNGAGPCWDPWNGATLP